MAKFNVDWNRYQQQFPTRYVKPGFFDGYVGGLLQTLKPNRILEVGGGINGMSVINQYLAKWPKTFYTILDPNITGCRHAHAESWEAVSPVPCDVIVARGTLNYLTSTEFAKIPNHLKHGGIFVANTFGGCPPATWTERRYTSADGTEGLERFRWNPDTLKIDHELRIGSSIDHDIIAHSFYYHSPTVIQTLLPGVVLTKYGDNSVAVYYEHSK